MQGRTSTVRAGLLDAMREFWQLPHRRAQTAEHGRFVIAALYVAFPAVNAGSANSP